MEQGCVEVSKNKNKTKTEPKAAKGIKIVKEHQSWAVK